MVKLRFKKIENLVKVEKVYKAFFPIVYRKKRRKYPLLAPQSGAHRIAPHRDPTHPSNPTYSSEARKTHDVIYF